MIVDLYCLAIYVQFYIEYKHIYNQDSIKEMTQNTKLIEK